MAEAKKITKREIGLIVGIIVGIAVYLIPIPGLERGGHITLALTLMTVVFWACQITQPAYVSGIFLMLLIVFGVVQAAPEAVEGLSGIKLMQAHATATAAVAFKSWTGQNLWLIIGAYLIAKAVETSGLGKRIAYSYMLRFVTGYKSVIIGIFVLTFILSLLIPHPWPRALMIMSVMHVIIKSSNVPKEDAVKIGFSVFAASVPVSLIFLTGDATINILAADYAGGLNFAGWVAAMGVPALVASVITLLMILFLFKPTQEININKEEIKGKLADLGKMSAKEWKTLIWIIIAIVLWLTDSLHGVQTGWVTIIVAMLMAFPIIGGVLTPPDWSAVPVQTLVFLTAAMAIGSVGGATGMNEWIATTFLGGVGGLASGSPFVFVAVITAIGIILHMLLGSVVAVMGVALPAILAVTDPIGMAPIAPVLIVYMAIGSHYIFPFQHLNMLVGSSEDTGGYTQKETIKLGLPYTVVVFIVTVVVMVPWFMLTGKM
ncbi:MAG: anion permease [Actinomycetes bacterium]|jgi:di/tricarboxylate transporter|nr:anion permease [Actinomycetes bacterium]